MTSHTKRYVLSTLSGALFGVGLCVSGMTRPEKVIAFLDVTGRWDPSLAFVMLGAVAVHFTAYRLIRRRPAPLYAPEFFIPTRHTIDLKLIGGAALFGIGWGLAGYCPGPGVVSLGAAAPTAIVFVAALLAGLLVTGKVEVRQSRAERRLPLTD
jgi:uncharacterized membrane protein YedE/YeeE